MPVLAALPAGPNLFSSPPPNPRINDPLPANSLPPLPIPARFKKKPPAEPSSPPPPALPAKPPSLKAVHSRTRYYKPVSEGVLSDDNSGRSVVVGPSGVSYRLPGAPFEFQFSYSETPKVKPLAIREPAFLPFAPPTMNRPWTGKAPLLSKKDKERKKKVRLFEPLGHDADKGDDDERLDDEGGKVLEMAGRPVQLGWYPKDGRSREEILGAPLKRWEVRALVKPYLSKNRQVNLGRDGLTHNMLELIHSHWRRQEVCKVRCRGVPTVDMDNVCHHLEEKTGGKIIYRIGGIVYLFRGRNYNPRTRPKYPVMLWKPATPVYPKLIQEAPEGLTKIEADVFREKGRILLPICKLAKNGIYLNLVKDVRDAFEESELVKVDCQGMHASDYKKLGAKLKDLVPCVLLSFDEEQILMWRGKDWKSRYRGPLCLDTKPKHSEDADSSHLCGSDQYRGSGVESLPGNERFSTKMVSLWKRAVETNKALLLDDTELSPDSLLKRVEDFEGLSQAAEHSYNALIIPSGRDPDDYSEGRLRFGSNDDYSDIDGEFSDGDTYDDDDYDDENDDVYDSLNETDPTLPFGSLPLDSIIEGLAED